MSIGDAVLGIDIGKHHDQAMLLRNNKYYHRTFRNHKETFGELSHRLAQHQISAQQAGHVCLEATATYWEAL